VLHRQVLVGSLVVVGICAVISTAALLLGVGTEPAAGQSTAHAATTKQTVTKITVTVGKPSEFRFTLSKQKIPAVGTVLFTVVNKGKIAHNFKIAGKKTPLLAPGKSATLLVVFRSKGRYAYLCTLVGHASAGMKGSFGVGTVTPPPPPPTTTAPVPASCANPQTTTVQVSMFEYGYTLSQTTVPCGTVTFVGKNTGAEQHNIHFTGVQGGVGQLIGPGETTTQTVQFTGGKVSFQCDVFNHATQGMTGTLTVSG
jgi:uncharacterized cupredoxin-like copper-binding protein